MSDSKICSSSELKDFAWSTEPTAFNFARWLESKTSNKYTIVEKQLIRDALQALEGHVAFANEVNESLKKKWQDVIAMMML